MESGGLCCVTGTTVTRLAQLFNLRLLASAPFREAGMRLINALIYAAGSWDEVEHVCMCGKESISGPVGYKCQCKCYYSRTICRCCLTSFFAFLWRLGFLGEAGVQPGSGFAVVTEVHRGDRALGKEKLILKTFKMPFHSAISTGNSQEPLYPGAISLTPTNKQELLEKRSVANV